MKVTACAESELPPGSVKKISAGGRDILVLNTGSGYCAVDDTCTHAGASLSEGRLEEGRVVCGGTGPSSSALASWQSSPPRYAIWALIRSR